MIHKNTFEGGLKSDLTDFKQSANTFESAINLKLSSDNNFLALENIRGTTLFSTLESSIDDNQQLLAVFENEYKINGESGKRGFTSFLYNTSTRVFKIVLTAIDSATSFPTASNYTIYEEILSVSEASLFLASNPIVEGIKYSENGIDTIYFTDGYNELRKVRCEVTTTVTSPITKEALSLLKRACFGNINFSTSSSGGSILSGSYQFALRLFNTNTETYTKFTLFTAPIPIFNESEIVGGDKTRPTGDVLEVTNKVINLNIDITSQESNEYSHYQLAVISNNQPTPANTVQLLTPSPISSGVTAYNYNYESNDFLESRDISEFVVDKAAISKVKALTIKNNRLITGNIEYHSLDYDNGDPSISSGSILRRLESDDPEAVGYWRDEVYRYGISYFDEFYNFSRPKILNLSGVVDNKASTGVDMKFPKIYDSGNYQLLSATSNVPIKLGLRFSVDNHPTWAKGFVILRAKRKKNIISQTPLIPMTSIEALPARDNYPSSATENGDVTVAYDTAQPQNPLGLITTKNFFQSTKRNAEIDPPVIGAEYKGPRWVEETFTRSGTPSLPVSFSSFNRSWDYRGVFIPSDVLDSSQLNTTSFDPKESTNVDVVDCAFLKLKYLDDTPSTLGDGTVDTSVEAGETIETKTHGTFYAVEAEDYYSFSSVGSEKALNSESNFNSSEVIEEYEFINNISEGVIIGGNPVNRFSNLETSGISWGIVPTNSKMGVIKLSNPRPDIISYIDPNRISGSITPIQVEGGSIPSSFFENTGSDLTNEFCFNKSGYSDGNYVNAVEIANITSNLDDDRYGPVDNNLEMISTGTYHVFSTAELTSVETGASLPIQKDVFGGDCHIGVHNYKISDGHYSILNNNPGPDSNADLLNKWRRFFKTSGGSAISIAVPLDNVSQVISVVLESDFKESVLGTPVYNNTSRITGAGTTLPIAFPSSVEAGKSPFTYFYNDNLSKENSDKIFIPFAEFENQTNLFPARVAWSNQKIYQSDQEGFDTFSALDFIDLDETYRGISAIKKASDRVIAFQEDAVAYLPVDADVIETADGASLSVRTGEIISTPVYISNVYGSQLNSTVEEASDKVYFVDFNRKHFFSVDSSLQLTPVSDLGLISEFRLNLNDSNLLNYNYRLSYDSNRREFLFFKNKPLEEFCYVYNDRLNLWEPNLDFSSPVRLLNAVDLDGNLYLLAKNSVGDLEIATFYTGDYNNFFGDLVTPLVSFSVNSEIEFSKTFDNVMLYSSGSLDNMDFTVKNDGSDIVVSGIPINGPLREGIIRVKTLRDGFDRRLRGVKALATVRWDPNDNQKKFLDSVITKYRKSFRTL
jgi:hypothetical protein